MAVTVLFMSAVIERLWVILPNSPYFLDHTAMAVTAGVMSFGGIIAFLMVWTEFTVIAQTSALTFMVAGTFKELVTGAHCVLTLASAVPCLGAASQGSQAYTSVRFSLAMQLCCCRRCCWRRCLDTGVGCSAGSRAVPGGAVQRD